MKQKIFIILLFLLFFFLIVVFGGVYSIHKKKSIYSTAPEPSSARNVSSVSLPVTISIPKISVSTHIEKVGVDSKGRIDVPKIVTNVAWYSLGVKPGEAGSAVIDGHFDKPDGSPSVFYKLHSLTPGDKIIISDETGKSYPFFVTEVKTYDISSIPMGKILEKTSEKRLNLITCAGVWDKMGKGYSQRIVVFSRLSGS